MKGVSEEDKSAFEISLFKRQDKSYIIGFDSFGELENAYYILEYKDDKWFDVVASVVPH